MLTATPTQGCYLVEWYHPDFTTAQLDDATAALEAASAVQRSEGTSVQLLVTVAAPNDEVLYSVFAANSADDVIHTCAQAGHPVERITSEVDIRFPEATCVAHAAADQPPPLGDLTVVAPIPLDPK